MPTSSRRESQHGRNRGRVDLTGIAEPTRPESNLVPLSTRTPKDLMRRLKVAAATRDETVQDIVNRAIERELDHLADV